MTSGAFNGLAAAILPASLYVPYETVLRLKLFVPLVVHTANQFPLAVVAGVFFGFGVMCFLDRQVAWRQAASRRSAFLAREKEVLLARMGEWEAHARNDIRRALASLHTVLDGWDCGWKPMSMADLHTVGDVRRARGKAMIIVHPDKVQQKAVSEKYAYLAKLVYNVLEKAWNKEKAQIGRG